MDECVFPCNGSGTHGLTLREYFAAHAPPVPDDWSFQLAEGQSKADRVAAWAFQYAEAMMERREFDRKIHSRMV